MPFFPGLLSIKWEDWRSEEKLEKNRLFCWICIPVHRAGAERGFLIRVFFFWQWSWCENSRGKLAFTRQNVWEVLDFEAIRLNQIQTFWKCRVKRLLCWRFAACLIVYGYFLVARINSQSKGWQSERHYTLLESKQIAMSSNFLEQKKNPKPTLKNILKCDLWSGAKILSP